MCLLYFYCPKYGGRYWFKGPIKNVGDGAAEADSVRESLSIDDEKKIEA